MMMDHAVLAAVTAGSSMTVAQIAEAAGVSSPQAATALLRLERDGTVVAEQGRPLRYRPAGAAGSTEDAAAPSGRDAASAGPVLAPAATGPDLEPDLQQVLSVLGARGVTTSRVAALAGIGQAAAARRLDRLIDAGHAVAEPGSPRLYRLPISTAGQAPAAAAPSAAAAMAGAGAPVRTAATAPADAAAPLTVGRAVVAASYVLCGLLMLLSPGAGSGDNLLLVRLAGLVVVGYGAWVGATRGSYWYNPMIVVAAFAIVALWLFT